MKNKKQDEKILNYLNKRKEKQIVNKFFSDDIITKLLNSSDGIEYIVRLVMVLLYGKVPKVLPKVKLLHRKISPHRKYINSEVDVLLDVEGVGMVDLEVNKTVNEKNRRRNDYYMALLELDDLETSDDYDKKKDIIQINLDIKNRFKWNYMVLDDIVTYIHEQDHDFCLTPRKFNKKYYINLEMIKYIDYNDIEERKDKEIIYLMSLFTIDDVQVLEKLYKERNDKCMLNLLKKAIKYYNDPMRIYLKNKDKYVRDELRYDDVMAGKEMGIEEGLIQGRDAKSIEVARKMIEDEFIDEDILKYSEISIEDLEKLKEEIKNENKKVKPVKKQEKVKKKTISESMSKVA